eukprot:12820057-Heterocapsa_arctica.AAC.1
MPPPGPQGDPPFPAGPEPVPGKAPDPPPNDGDGGGDEDPTPVQEVEGGRMPSSKKSKINGTIDLGKLPSYASFNQWRALVRDEISAIYGNTALAFAWVLAVEIPKPHSSRWSPSQLCWTNWTPN